ncbi:MAG: LemA family protein [Gemmatimonadales bacterium]|nr:MAG: LemA family protein [Gemmatimonadales bacterium]
MTRYATRWLVVLAAVFLSGCGYNRIQGFDEQVNKAQGQIQAQLQRRADLIPNLVETVKGYAKQEETIFTEVADARARLAGSVQSGNLEDMAAANQALDAPLGRLLALVENYPQLKSDANFRALQDELTGTENRIATARQDYNDAVNQFNSFIRTFPYNLTARMFGHHRPRAYLEARAGAEEPPPVKF